MRSSKFIFLALCLLFFSSSARAGFNRSVILLDEAIDSVLEFSIEPVEATVISVEANDRLYPVQVTDEGKYLVNGFSKLEPGSVVGINFVIGDELSPENINIQLLYQGRVIKSYDVPTLILDLIPLANVTDTLKFGTVGTQDIHKVGFNIGANQISEGGEIWVTFNSTFDLSGIIADSSTYSDNDPANDSDQPQIDSIYAIGQTVILKLNDGTPAVADSRINVRFGPVQNFVSDYYMVTVQTLDSTGTLIHTPTNSPLFWLAPDVLDHILISPAGSRTVPSDSIVFFYATGRDQYNNVIPGQVFTWSVTVDSCGTVNNGAFRARKVGQCHVVAQSSGLTDSSGLITVTPGSFGSFGLTGYPSSVTAGSFFPAPVVVTAYDINSNRIYNYADSIYFISNDDSASFTYDIDNRYVFQSSDSGRVSLAGNNFILKLAGSRTISVTNGIDATTSNNITVLPALISSFSLSPVGSQTAGIAFSLTVIGAVDLYGNPGNGTVIVDDLPGEGGNSPDGVPPVFNNILVSNGTGSASQILTNAVPTRLKGTINAIADTTNVFAVSPGITGSIRLTNYPDTVTAGAPFSTNPVVTVTDIYGNRSINYNGTIHFEGPEVKPPPRTFVPASDSGLVVFNGDQFAFQTSGSKRLYVYDADSSLGDTSSAIQVFPGAIASFVLSAPANVTAGLPFTLTVSEARDADSNLTSGIVVITDSLGAGNSPDGSTPSLNNIVVSGGSGSAQQILVRSGTAVLKGTSGSVIRATDDILVAPEGAYELILSNYPDTITAGVTFPSPANDPRVTVRDTYGNLATNYTGTVTISGIEHVAPPHTFVPGDLASYAFDGDLFWFENSGLRRLISSDGVNGLADTSSAIQVFPGAIATFVLSAPANVTAGAPFSLTVSEARDADSNLTSGIVVITDSLGAGNSPDGSTPSLNNITVSGGSGSAQQILVRSGTAVLKGTSGTVVEATGNITVSPAPAFELILSNYPDTITAGATFPSPANDPTVTVRDTYGNLATGYTGTVTISGIEHAAPPHTFVPGDLGSYAFDGDLFWFEGTGLRRLIASDAVNGLADTSSSINVRSSGINTFVLTAPSNVTAGTPFAVSVSGAVDQYGNPASGVVVIADSLGAGNSPDGSTPSLNNIVVSGGSGSAQQILVRSGTAILKGTSGSVIRATGDVIVAPEGAYELVLSNYPDTITAGATFPSPANDPTVTVRDTYGNLATNYTGTVTISGIEHAASPHTFVPGDLANYAFDGDLFWFETSGLRRLIASDAVNGLADTSSSINVRPGIIAAFTLTAPSDVTAGTPFAASVSGAVDQYGNPASGVVVIADSLGAGNSPDGSTPSLNNITVSGGSGSAQQILVRSGTAVLKGTSGTVVEATGNITVSPASAFELVLSNYPDTITAGATFPSPANDPTVTVRDTYGNLATGYTGTVTISGIEHAAPPHTFVPGDLASYAFDGDLFWFEGTGLRRLIASDAVNGLADTSSSINVRSSGINTFVLTAPSNVTAGTPFGVSVSGAVDQYGNPASGVVVIADSLGAGNSPDGTPPVLNDITVTNGSGSALQTLVNQGIAVLKGTSGSIIRATGNIDVGPSVVRELILANYPDTVTAGQTFPSPANDPIVTAQDTYGNRMINYAGTVSFSGPEVVPPDRTFSPSDSGRVVFPGSDFIFETAGIKRLIVTDIGNAMADTSSPIYVLSSPIDSFVIAAPANINAGEPFDLSINNAVDQYGNPTSGIVTVSGVSGTGNAPDGSAPTFANINVANGSGSAQQILVRTGNALMRGVSGSFADTTSNIAVNPGALGNVSLTSYPDTVTAGDGFSLDPIVTLYDIFLNRATNYLGTVSFAGIENAPADYPFDIGDVGQHVFSGSEFIFETSGSRRLRVNESVNALADTSDPIQVFPAEIDSFSLSEPTGVVAGVAFTLSATDVVDRFGNATSGLIDIDTVGNARSPNGSVPIINDIIVTNGSGSAQQTLVRAALARLRGTHGGFTDTTNVFSVLPGSLGQLNIFVNSPQVSGTRFEDPSSVIAKDVYANTKTDFDASTDSITISASTNGPMINNVLRSSTDFVSGVADLTDLNVTYNGFGGPVVFTATSQSGISGASNTVHVQSVRADAINLDVRQVARGDTARGSLTISNMGNLPVRLTNIDISAGGEEFDEIFSPPFDSIDGGSDSTFSFFFIVNTLDNGSYPVNFTVTGSYSGTLTSDELLGGDTLIIVTRSNLTYLPGSLSPAVVSRGENYPLQLQVQNNGDVALSLVDSSYIYFTDGIRIYQAELSQNSFIGPGAQTALTFNSELIPVSFINNQYAIDFHIFGSDVGGEVVDSITLSDSILVQSPADVAYNDSSIQPTEVLRGSSYSFSARVHNDGEATLVVNHDITKITFADTSFQYLAYIDTSSENRIDSIATGDTTLTFLTQILPPDFALGYYVPVITVAGIQNERPYSINLSTDSIQVLNPGELRLDSLFAVAPNAPRVNVGQQFTIHGFVSNLGNEAVDSIALTITSDGNSEFANTIFIESINGGTGMAFDHIITADSLPNQLESFFCEITGSEGDVPVASPLDNSAAAIIELDAELWLDSLYLSDDSLSTGQQFMVYARVNHSGSQSYDGTEQLIININNDPGFEIADSLTRNFAIGQFVSWNVTAPSTERAPTPVTVTFNGTIIDLNDSTTALGVDSLSSDVVVTESASITHVAYITGPSGALDGTVSTGQSLVVTDSLFPVGNVGNSYAALTLPEGFSSSDPLTQTLTGGAILWHLRAGDSSMEDSLGFQCWSFDSNTGDSVSDEIIWLPIAAVTRATLSLSSNITDPPSAVDRIIPPGGAFTLEISVTNVGEALTDDGDLALLFESSGFIADPDTQIFNPGTPIQWDITAPDFQIPDGTSIGVVLTRVPIDENSGAPAVVLNDSTGLDVIIKEELPRLVLRDYEAMEAAAVAGQPVDVFRLSLENSTEIASEQVAIASFDYRVISENQTSRPSNMLQSSSLIIDGNVYPGTLGDSLVQFSFDPPIGIEPDSLSEIMINLTPASNPPASSFRIMFGSQDIVARVVIGDVTEQYVDVVRPDGEEFTLQSINLATIADDFISSTMVNQNPYLASAGDLMVGYNLESDATLEITVYSVYGDVVWEYVADAANGRGAAGQHYDNTAVHWDGRNSSGDKVLSGVYYIIVNNTTSGQTAKLKVAVVW